MKLKKLLVLVVLLSLWGGTMMLADTASQRVKVIVNGSELSESGLLEENKTYLPLRQIAGTLQSLISWDNSTGKVTLNKPNVHMFLFKDTTVFGKVNKGSKVTFSAWAQVDSLFTDISAFKIVIAGPDGKEELIQSQEVTSQKDNFWFRTKEVRYQFDSEGNYPVRMYMKPSGSDEWNLVSEKLIIAE